MSPNKNQKKYGRMSNSIYDYGERFRVEDIDMETNGEEAFKASSDAVVSENITSHIISEDDY